jgi:pyruvate dehydrogenase E2 component (dihydrolipoamide acetyltransferase)
MALELKLPELGENIEGGDVVSVLVQPGDEVQADQPVLELETDKATVEVPAALAGRVKAVHVAAGDRIKVGQLIATLEESKPSAPPAGKPSGERVKAAQAGASGKAKAVAPAPEPPKAAPTGAPEPAAADVSSGAPTERNRGAVVEFRERPKTDEPPRKVVAASPAVRRFAREIGIDINEVPGSGPRGRVSVDDVKAYSRRLRTAPAAGVSAAPALPDFTRFGPVERRKFSNIRRATARNLSLAWQQVVHVTNHDRADVTRLEALRQRFVPRVEAAGGKLTVTALLLKLCASLLREFPKFNASLDMAAEEVIFKQYIHIGVAVDTERGLLVPVIRDVDRKGLVQLSVELKELAEKARAGKIQPDDLQGGSFTITNLGGIGGTGFTPVVNYPEVAILGVSRTSVEPVYAEGRFEPRPFLPLSLSYDHRLVDGADAARFLRRLVELIEEPAAALL